MLFYDMVSLRKLWEYPIYYHVFDVISTTVSYIFRFLICFLIYKKGILKKTSNILYILLDKFRLSRTIYYGN